MLDLFQTASQDQLANAAQNPVKSLETTAGEAFGAAWDANMRYRSLGAMARNTRDAAQDWLDGHEKLTGEKLENPYAAGGDFLTFDYQRYSDARKKVEDATQRYAVERNDPSYAFPDDQALFRQGVKKGQAALQRAAEAGQGQQGFGTTLAGLGAGLAAPFADPADAMLNGIAMATIPVGGGMLRSALMAGTAFGAQEAATGVVNLPYQRQITPERGGLDIAKESLEAAAGGVALDLAGHGLGALWRRYVRKAPEAAADLPTPVRDAAIVAERAEDLNAQNPFRGLQGEAAFNEAVPAVERALVNGEPVVLPEAAVQAAQARTGQVNTPVTPDASDLIDRQAYSISPKLFQQVGDLDNKIAAARAEIQRVSAQRGEPDEGGALTNRIAQVQSQLDQITGKRRSSPRAKALREELARLQEQEGKLAQTPAPADDTLQALRLNLVDLQARRGALGPKVRSVREHAAKMIGIDHEARGIDLDAAPSHSGRAFLEPEPAPAPAPAVEKPPAKQNRKARRAEKQPAQEQPALPPPTPEEVATARAQPAATNDRAFVGQIGVGVRYELAELGDLVASHDRDFRVNPDYPADLQPRDRGGKAARDQVYDMAAKLEPERLGPSPEANSGAPIVGPDNVVESGNGRTMAIRAAYDMGGERAAAYRAWLERQGHDTTGMKEPVLVARRTSPMSEAERADFAHAANGSASLRMNAVEQALSDARHISGDLVDLLQKGMVDSAANRDFIRALVAKMPAGERGGMVTATGQLSQTGVKRVQAALVARAYGDPGVVARAFDHAEPNIKTIAAALVEASPEWIKLREAVARGEVPAGHDITDAVMTAVKTIMRARDEGEPVARAMAQGDFFASDTSGLAARLFFKDNSLTRFLSKKDMGENLQTFAQAILEQRGKGEDLFGAPPPDTRQVLGTVAKLSDARQAKIAEALKPEVIEKAFSDPKVHEAAEADLRRAIDQGRNRVPVEDADGNVTMGFADAELKRIDDEIAAAQEIKACTTVQTEAAE